MNILQGRRFHNVCQGLYSFTSLWIVITLKDKAHYVVGNGPLPRCRASSSSGSGGTTGHSVIRGLLDGLSALTARKSKCPWARHRTPSCLCSSGGLRQCSGGIHEWNIRVVYLTFSCLGLRHNGFEGISKSQAGWSWCSVTVHALLQFQPTKCIDFKNVYSSDIHKLSDLCCYYNSCNC